jgi:hypothetical protein
VHWPAYKVIRDRIGAQRSAAGRRRAGEYLAEIEHGSLSASTPPETVARKIAGAIRRLGVCGFGLISTRGAQSIGARLRAVRARPVSDGPLVTPSWTLGRAQVSAGSGQSLAPTTLKLVLTKMWWGQLTPMSWTS